MSDKYGAGDDPYCYPGTRVLKNKLSIQDASLLEDAERDLSCVAAASIDFSEPPYDLSYLCHIHTILFQDLYDWAGELRRVDITKGTTRFCNMTFVETQANQLFSALAKEHNLSDLTYDDFIDRLAFYYCELNMIHPFREGNGRAQRVLFEHLAINAGYKISFETVNTEEWIEANIRGVDCDYSKMKSILNICISR
ncbi:putative adenosine monophosphate-protein transferase Fic [Vibrio quintilis]|uniref:protein adenylyltransferase n=1 Tax=Vibrio quintilis TaxID=1117707 RepID=A0A1M7YWV4_9VIBR|nr:putative adenosine monophosphate-protein transferase Fic [Vibrio quintilis]SHO57078.1 putative adenosine monophosphate-protein transferase fic [Vibrio quintilis]